MKLQHLSASRIKTFEDCQWKYYAKYQLSMPEPPSHPNTLMGSAVHLMFEKATDVRLGHAEGSENPLDYLEEASDEFKVEERLTPLMIELANNAVSWGYFRNIHRTAGAEVEVDFKLPNGIKVTGFIDRLDVWEDKADINDLKTQKREFDDATLKKNWQARIYNIGSRKIYPQVTGTSLVSFWLLRHRVQRVELSAQDAIDDIKELTKVADEIQGCSEPTCSKSGLCPWCPANNQCPVTKKNFKTPRGRKW